MKATGPCKAVWVNEKGGLIWIRPNREDLLAFSNLFSKKKSKEEKSGITIYPIVSISLPVFERTYKQLKTLWALITVIFISQNGRKPSEEEKYNLYLDILAEYADQVPTRFSGKLRPVHISESTTIEAAKLIQACFDIIVECCDLTIDLQADVRELFYEWEAWRGGLDKDPMDYDDDSEIDEGEWRANHKVSDASGIGGYLEKAHIASQGANPIAIEKPWNWLALTAEEHRFMHQHGWAAFLEKYPHLRGRVERAQEMVNKLTSERSDDGVTNAKM